MYMSYTLANCMRFATRSSEYHTILFFLQFFFHASVIGSLYERARFYGICDAYPSLYLSIHPSSKILVPISSSTQYTQHIVEIAIRYDNPTHKPVHNNKNTLEKEWENAFWKSRHRRYVFTIAMAQRQQEQIAVILFRARIFLYLNLCTWSFFSYPKKFTIFIY